jgi:hypothetical protein
VRRRWTRSKPCGTSKLLALAMHLFVIFAS